MAKTFLPEIGAQGRPGASPLVYILLGLLAIAVLGSTYITRFHWVTGLQTKVATLEAELVAEREARQAAEQNLALLTRQVQGLSAINDVELIYGDPDLERVPRDAVKLPYTRQGSVLVHKTDKRSLFYFTGDKETLGDIASHPRVLGSYYLWPILREENKLEGRGNTPLPPGTLVRVPTRLGDWRVRSATTAAGTPDKVRDEVFKQASIN